MSHISPFISTADENFENFGRSLSQIFSSELGANVERLRDGRLGDGDKNVKTRDRNRYGPISSENPGVGAKNSKSPEPEPTNAQNKALFSILRILRNNSK